MRYCFANWIDSPEGGKEPLLPEKCDHFLLIACFGPDAPWAIWDVGDLDNDLIAEGMEDVGEPLRLLLRSATAYSPAMAIACSDTARRWYGKSPSRSEFAESLTEALRQQLRAQPSSQYRLAEAVVDELGYLAKGEYVWILAYNSVSCKVSWVSSDFQIYQNSVGDFDLDDDDLAALM